MSEADEHDHCDHCDHEHGSNRAETVSLIVSGVLAGLAVGLHLLAKDATMAVASLSLAAMAAGGWFLLPKAWRAIRRLRPDINLLVVIAASLQRLTPRSR